MRHSRVVCFLAFALCLLACVSASAAGNNEEAKKEQAKNIIEKVCVQAKWYINTAQNLLQRVEPFKRYVAGVDSHTAQVLNRAETAAKGNEEATAIVNNVSGIAKTVASLHHSVTGELVKIVASLKELLSDAEKLKGECDTEIARTAGLGENDEEATNKALALKTKGDKLDENMTALVALMAGVDSTVDNMKQNLEKVQLANLRVSVVVSVTNIKTMMGDTDGISQETHNKKNEVNGIVQEVTKHCTPGLIGSNKIIETQCESANAELKKATGALEKAQQAEADMKQQKDIADTALTNVKTASEVNKAQEDVKNAKRCVEKVKESVRQLSSALDAAEVALTNAKVSQQKVVKALSTTTSAPTPEEVKETEKSNLSVQGGTQPDQKDTTTQPITTNTEQPTSKDALGQSDNSEDKLKDTLQTGAQNVPTTALTGGKAPAPGANNDSAMTVSVPLLVALIASAVLQ